MMTFRQWFTNRYGEKAGFNTFSAAEMLACWEAAYAEGVLAGQLDERVAGSQENASVPAGDES
jgi:hypothetical protein